MNKLTEWLVKPFIKEEFGAPAGTLPSPSQEKRKKAKKRLDKTGQRSVYSVSEIEENLPKIKKVVGIYGGRFQPFGPHHLKTYQWLSNQVDDAYITTSNIKQPPRHPMNFSEKVRHMVKMGVPKNRIIQEKTPYVAKNVLKKYDKDTTAVIYIFGKKDAGRLSGGKYFQDYKKNKNKMNGYEDNGYILTAPHVSIKVGGKEVSGTVMRDLLGSPQYKKNREKLFRQAFGYFDKGIFNMMNNKFKKLYEFIDNNIDKVRDIIKESSVMAGSPVDDGPPTFHISFNDYKTTSKAWIEKTFEDLGFQVINYMISKDAKDPLLDFSIRLNTVPAISYGNLNTSKEVAIAKYKKNMEDRVLNNVGFEIVKWFGLKDDFSETTGVDVAQPVLPGKHNAEKNTDLKEAFNLDDEVKFLLEVDGMLLEEGVKFNNFLKDWSKKAKQPLSKVRKTMMNKNTFSIAKLNDFSVDKVLDNAKKGFQAYQKILNYVPDKIAKKLAKTKLGQKKEKGLKKLDDFLQKHPKLKRVMGVAAAAGVTYAWTKMSFIGDPEYDLDLSDAVTAAAAGDFKMADLFSGEMGTKFLVLTAVGATTGLTAPYTKILGSAGTMAAGVTFGIARAIKKRRQKKDDGKEKKTSGPDTVKNPNPRGRKKMISKQSAVRWVSKNKGNKAAQKYQKSLSETLNLNDYVKLIIEEEDVMDKKIKYKTKDGNEKEVTVGGALKQGEEHPAYKKAKSMTDKGEKQDTSKKIQPAEFDRDYDEKDGGSTKKRMDKIKSFGKDPHGNLYLGDEEVGYEPKVHKAQYVTETDDSMVIGTPHMSDDDPKAGEFVKKQVVPMVQDFIKKHGAENVVFLGEGGFGDGHNYHEGTEQELVGKMVEKAGGGVDTWDGKYNEHTNQDAPIYKDLAKKMNATPSQMTGAVYSNIVGQGDDPKDAMKYLDKDGQKWLKDNGYKGGFPPSGEEVNQLFDLNYPEDGGGKPGSNPIAKAQLAWNQLRRDNMSHKMEELKKQGKKVLVVPGATHGSAINAQSKSKTEMNEAPRVPRKKGQHRGSKSHSDLYTDENPKGTIKGLKFATVADAKASVSKINGSGKSHAHKIQAAVAMEQRAKEMGKASQAAVYRAFINKMKKKTKKKNESNKYTFGPDWIPTSLAQRKKMKRIHQKTNRSIRKNESKLFSPDWWTQELDLNPQKKELLLMGGAAGHMSHPFDDNHLTFGDFKNIINMSLEGKLSREDNVTEKLDGQNLMISYVDGELRGARNKGHLKMFGKTSLNVAGMKSVFSGRGDIEKAFVGSMKDLENAIGKLSDKQKEKVFGNGSKWMNLEIMYPATANVIDYDVSELFFHGSVEVHEDGTVKSQVTDSARMLEGMIRQANANIQKRFKVSKPVVLNLPKVQDFSKKKKYFLSKLRKLQTIYRLKDNDTLGMHNEMYWREYIFNGAKQHKYKIPRNVLESLVKRWAYLNKSFRLDKKSIKHEKFLGWAKGVDKFDHKKLSYDNIKPLELLFLELGAEILKNLEGFLAVNPKKAVQKIKKDLKSAISGLKTSKDIKKIDLLKKNLNKINSIGGTSAIVPSEGLVFKYKGNMYKFTGAFAPVNQIIGALKF